MVIMSPLALWLCITILIGSCVATDVPFVFDKNTSSIGRYTSAQLEQAHTRSPELAGIPSISTLADNAILEFPIVGGGNAPSGTIENKAGEYKKILNARVESDNSRVHEEALVLVAKYPGDYTIDQICSIFEYLKDGWHYVRDPRGVDYFNYANSTLSLCNSIGCAGIGDCDDFAVLMSALVESIGGTSRIILAQNNTTGGHAYAEVYLGQLGDPSNQVNDIIKWLFQKYNTDKIFVHIETDTNEVWLNLDWGSDEKGNAHPGGPFYQGDTHHVLHIRDNVTKTPLKLPEGYKPKKPISQDASALVNKAKALLDLGRYDEALQASENAIELDPDYAIAWNNKGAALINLHRYDEALQALEKAIELDPTYEKAWSNKAAALIDLHRYDEALQASEKAIKQKPYYAKAWNNKADSLFNLGRIDEALKASEKAIELDPTYENSWNEKAVVLNNLGRYDEAFQAAERAIELKPTFAKAWLNKGMALLNQGKYDQAVKAFDEAIRLDPNYDMAWNNKGWTLYKQGKYDEALQAYDKAVEINPKFAKAWNNIGTALSALHRDAEADAAFAKASASASGLK
jgi:tetratricopeptide (TPR) repeat protein